MISGLNGGGIDYTHFVSSCMQLVYFLGHQDHTYYAHLEPFLFMKKLIIGSTFPGPLQDVELTK